MGRRAKINTKKRNRRIILLAALAVAVVAIVGFAYLIEGTFAPSPYSSYIYKPVPSTLLQQVTGVSDSTLAAVGSASSVSSPRAINGSALTLNGKPEIIYIGAEYCPYCAVERWAMIMALSKFGNFSGIQYMLSSGSDVNPNTPTFTFQNATYVSQYISFVPIEEFNRTNEATPWHTLTTAEDALVSSYGSGGIPFIDLGNQYVVNGVQTTIDLQGQNWTQVASQLNNPTSSTAIGIDGAANKLVSAICLMDGEVPSAVCSQNYATIPLSYSSPGATSSALAASSIFSANMMGEKTRWTS
ncbi:MAG: DUF929 domain-containing protein [Thaumarchaeota archaeon]|nr:DUF929 domain-containing protein [Nitrososphaerota archaeon]